MKSIENSYFLSSMQQGMLFHSSLAENSGYYVEQIVCHLHHEVDTTALIKSW